MTSTRHGTWAATAVVALLLAGCAGPARADVAVVQITDAGFEAATLTVPVGTEVRWVNDGSVAHTVTTSTDTVGDGEPAVPAGAPAFDSGPVRPGETFAHRFEVAGTYLYWCSDHRDEQMLGTVRVEEP